MGKNIYELLNQVEVNLAEYEDVTLSSEKIQSIQTRVFKEMNHMKKRNGNRKKIRNMQAAAACVALVLVGGITAMASGIFNDEIEQLISNAKGTKYEAEDVAIYEKVGEMMALDDDPAQEKEKVTAEDQGLTLAITDSFCDGYLLYYTATLSGDPSIFNGSDSILSSSEWVKDLPEEAQKKVAVESFRINGVPAAGNEHFHPGENGTYVMMGQIDLLSMVQQGEIDLAGLESLDVEYQAKEFLGSDLDEIVYTEQEEINEDGEIETLTVGDYRQTMDVEGEWKLSFTVPVDLSKNQEFDINKQENGVVLKKATKTPLGLVLQVELPDLTVEPYSDPYNDPDIAVCSGETPLQWLSNYGEYREDNTSAYTIMVLYDGEGDLSLRVTNKNRDGGMIANIPFEVLAQ